MVVLEMEGTGVSENDSDLEMETETPPLDQLVGLDVVQHLKPKERNRQEAIKATVKQTINAVEEERYVPRAIGSEQAQMVVLEMKATGVSENDSDLEMETETPPLDQLVGLDVVQHLKPKERNRQEAIKELFHAEYTHVRNLKVLSGIFHMPASWNNVVSPDVTQLLFANLDGVIEIHMGWSPQIPRQPKKLKFVRGLDVFSKYSVIIFSTEMHDLLAQPIPNRHAPVVNPEA
ncbi:unnamed protein product [Angiostrongylus costaricensis]|uniref:DH domain-containing protein n=1 Tax=Angiostrongylus costaricensis TaxID=334426 RepID=A0A0R3PY49_ANGCS|nr:unnamed protein product [Angiostrongylus costaricensis]